MKKCKGCGAPVEGRTKRAAFCTRKCKQDYYNAIHRARRKAGLPRIPKRRGRPSAHEQRKVVSNLHPILDPWLQSRWA